MTYNKETLKNAIVQKLRLNYGCTEQQATGLYRGDRKGFDTVRHRGMTSDFSWGRSAAAYRHIYENL